MGYSSKFYYGGKRQLFCLPRKVKNVKKFTKIQSNQDRHLALSDLCAMLLQFFVSRTWLEYFTLGQIPMSVRYSQLKEAIFLERMKIMGSGMRNVTKWIWKISQTSAHPCSTCTRWTTPLVLTCLMGCVLGQHDDTGREGNKGKFLIRVRNSLIMKLGLLRRRVWP